MAVRLSALRIGRTLLPRNNIFLFLVLISVRGSEPQSLMRSEGLGKFKIHLIGFRNHDFPSCIIVHCFKYKEQTCFQFTTNHGCAINLDVSRWLPTAEARFRGRVMSRVNFGGQIDTGVGFLGVLRFSFPLISPTTPHSSPSSSSSGAGTIVERMAHVPSGLNHSPLQET
jgi:hypothetical protein